MLEEGYRECPNAGRAEFDVDYGIGYGHICELCKGTGQVPCHHPIGLRMRAEPPERWRCAGCGHHAGPLW